MKICIVSDSHGDRDILQKIYNLNSNCDIYLHLGDSQLDSNWLLPFISVKGNCDYFSDYPDFKIISTPFGNIYAEHGHLHNHCTIDFLKSKNCQIYLYGHTHIHKIVQIGDYYFFNPGSVSSPRDGTCGTYLILELKKDIISYQFKSV